MTGTTDTGFENLFPTQPLDYPDNHTRCSSNLWTHTAFLEPTPVHAECWDGIEQAYTELHKSVDWVMSQIPLYQPLRRNQVREQNRKLIAKLESLDGEITRETILPAAVVNDSSLLAYSSAVDDPTRATSVLRASSVNEDLPVPATLESRQAMPENYAPLIQNTHVESSVHKPSTPSPRRYSFATGKDGSGLAKKLLKIGNQEARLQVAEFATQLQGSISPSKLPKISHFPSHVPRITDGPDFLQLVTNLGLTIESSIFGEQNSRIRKRVALVHFYHAYTLAQDHPEVFLSWCDDQRVQPYRMLPKGGSKSVVQHRFADLIFSRDVQLGGSTPTVPRPCSDSGDDAKRRAAKVQTWRKSGRKWAQFTQRFGNGILLLLPPCLSDEDLRIASDRAVGQGLDLVDSRKHLFADILQQANDLLETHFFLPDRDNSSLRSHRRFDSADWDDLLNTLGTNPFMSSRCCATPGMGSSGSPFSFAADSPVPR